MRQVPQLLFISFAEVLVSVTGLLSDPNRLQVTARYVPGVLSFQSALVYIVAGRDIPSRLYTIGGLERWTGLVDWTTGLTDFPSETR